MTRLLATLFPGFWLSVWQYGVLLFVWYALIEPTRMFLKPWDLNAGALGFFALGMMMGTATAFIILVDSMLYVSILSSSWLMRGAIVLVTTMGGGLMFMIVYVMCFSYGADSTKTPMMRWTWITVYAITVGILLFAHLHAIWRFRNALGR